MDNRISRRSVLGGLALSPLAACRAASAEHRSLEALLQRRRMVRRFKSEQPSDALIRRLIEAATRAPSAGNSQPWAFVVVRDAAMRRRLGRAAFGQMFVAEAPVVVVPCVDAGRASQYGARAARYAQIDTAFASLLLLLAVTEEGLGACFVGAMDEHNVARLLGLPAGVEPLALIPVGYPDETPQPQPRRRLADVVHSDRWGGRVRKDPQTPRSSHPPR